MNKSRLALNFCKSPVSTRKTGEVSSRPSLVSEESLVLPAYPASKTLIEAVPNLAGFCNAAIHHRITTKWESQESHVLSMHQTCSAGTDSPIAEGFSELRTSAIYVAMLFVGKAFVHMVEVV